MVGKDCLPIAYELRKEDKSLRDNGVIVSNAFEYDELDAVGVYMEVCNFSQRYKRLYCVTRYYCKDFDIFTTLVQKFVTFANMRKTMSVRICDYECWDGALYSTFTKLAGDFVCL